eukprot:TRINITY_DN80_c0_g2_i3.p1 TRINITY_DN80_c0_g2~~TRINITY_DN80_c0_g2_i3.p1  ORF type:complete len:535 (-),score=94.04 TRINITY_DN80_c0_g2_i3:500-2104(-)
MNAPESPRGHKHSSAKRSRKSRPHSAVVTPEENVDSYEPISIERSSSFKMSEKREDRRTSYKGKGKETDHKAENRTPRDVDKKKSDKERTKEEICTSRRKKTGCDEDTKSDSGTNEDGEGRGKKIERETKKRHEGTRGEKKKRMSVQMELPPMNTIEEDVVIHSDVQWIPRTFEEIPPTVLTSALKFIPKAQIESNLNVFFHVAWFTQSKEFPPNFMVYTRTKPLQPYCLPHQFDQAKRLIEIPPEKLKKLYKNIDFVNRGGFGRVFSGRDTKTKIMYAIKKLPHETLEEEEANLSEIFFLSECKHPNIVESFHFFLSNEKSKKDMKELWVIMEFMKGGTLGEAAVATDLCDDHIAFVAGEIAKGLSYLHQRNFVHRDVKSANVMMSITGQIKLIDLGLCCELETGPRTKMLGSPYWIPPEMILGLPHSFTADTWSLAVCILELYLKEPPLYKTGSLACMFTVATSGLIQCIPSHCTPQARDFLEKSLVIDASKRTTCTELMEHPWTNRPNINAGIEVVLSHTFLTKNLVLAGI